MQAFYTVRSERQLIKQLDYNWLFRWFVGLSIDDPVWDATVFCKNRDRLFDGNDARPGSTVGADKNYDTADFVGSSPITKRVQSICPIVTRLL